MVLLYYQPLLNQWLNKVCYSLRNLHNILIFQYTLGSSQTATTACSFQVNITLNQSCHTIRTHAAASENLPDKEAKELKRKYYIHILAMLTRAQHCMPQLLQTAAFTYACMLFLRGAQR